MAEIAERFALVAVLLAELSSGRRLFDGASDFETYKQIVEEPPRYVCPPELPGLEAVVLKGLARDRARRYETALALHQDLEALARDFGLGVSTLGVASFMRELFGDPRLRTRRLAGGSSALGFVLSQSQKSLGWKLKVGLWFTPVTS